MINKFHEYLYICENTNSRFIKTVLEDTYWDHDY